MNRWAPITYMGFWDVPLVFVAPGQPEWFLFECEFDENTEDYRDCYKVYTIPASVSEELPKDWTTLRLRATRFLGEIPVEDVRFDPSKRREIDLSVLGRLVPLEDRPGGTGWRRG